MQVFRALAGIFSGTSRSGAAGSRQKASDVLERERAAFVHGVTAADGTVEVEGCRRRGFRSRRRAVFDEMVFLCLLCLQQVPCRRLCHRIVPDRLPQMLLSPGIHGGAADQRDSGATK